MLTQRHGITSQKTLISISLAVTRSSDAYIMSPKDFVPTEDVVVKMQTWHDDDKPRCEVKSNGHYVQSKAPVFTLMETKTLHNRCVGISPTLRIGAT